MGRMPGRAGLVGVESVPEEEGGHTLGQQRVGELEVKVQNGHHSSTHQHDLEPRLELVPIILAHGDGNELARLAAHGRCCLDVLQRGLVYIGVSRLPDLYPGLGGAHRSWS